jgi:lactate permease
LCGKVQFAAARSIGVDPVVTVSANVSGGVVGKMISPQSIAIAAASVNLIGKESSLFRFTVKHSFIMLLFVCMLTVAQVYIFTWLVPAYHLADAKAIAASRNVSLGYICLSIVAVLIAAIAFYITRTAKKEIKNVNAISLTVTE